MPVVMGMSAFFHDSACCLVRDGAIVAAAQEERFSRQKHDPSLPMQAFRWCLEQAHLTMADLDGVAYYEAPFKKLERQLWQLRSGLSRDRCFGLWRQARQPAELIRSVLGYEGDIDVFEHHRSHAASAFFCSGWPDAAILTVDGVGEWATTTYGRGRGDEIDLFEEVPFPHSLGLLYSTLTGYLGFGVNDGEYKVMGLAPYGQPRYVDRLRQVIRPEAGGQYRLDLRYFDFVSRERMHTDALVDLLGCPARHRDDPLSQDHRDIARSLQIVLEDILLEKVRYLHARVGGDALCLAGGVALNCVANGRLRRDGPFARIFVQPAAGDAGGAVGAALLAHARRAPLAPRQLEDAYLGPAYSNEAIADLINRVRIRPADYRGRESALIDAVVDLLCDGKVIAWFQGRMEFGPRALGARSILADPRAAGMRDHVNLLIKERESFRPFAPAVLDSLASVHFELDHPSPFMLETCRVRSALPLPAVTHVDGSARVQTVDARTNPRFARLLAAFHARTGCPMLLNTSFNLRDEPIVAAPVDALRSFARSQLDALVIEDFLVARADLSSGLVANCRGVRLERGRTEDRVYTF